MQIGKSWTTDERAEVIDLCQRNHQLLVKLDLMLGKRRPLETLSTRDIWYLAGFQIERMISTREKTEVMLQSDGIPRNKEGQHD